MKHKSIFLSMLAMIMVAMLSIACSSDDSNDDNSSSGVVGKWVKQEESDQFILVFNSGGSGTWVEMRRGKYEDTAAFVYIPDGDKKGKLILTYSDDEIEVWYYMIEEKTMFLYERGYGEELEIILTKTE